MNTFLTTHLEVLGPPLVQDVEGARMPEPEGVTFPRWFFPAGGPAAPPYGGRCFASQDDLDAAADEGPWFETPQEAARAGSRESGSREEGVGGRERRVSEPHSPLPTPHSLPGGTEPPAAPRRRR